MIFQVLMAVIVAKIRKLEVLKALIKPVFYPFYIVELVYIFFQINVFLGNYQFVSYASILKTATLYSLLIPIFVYKLYLPALAGSGFIFVGSILNEMVKHANGGKMPVYPTLSRLTGYFKEGMLDNSSLHIIGTPDSHYKFLSDYIDVGYSILSIGDLFVHSFVFIVFYYGIKAVTRMLNGGNLIESDS